MAERTRAEQALKEADRHKDEFLAMLAHELRNPLAPIRNAVQLMKMKAVDDPQLLLSRDIIERQLIQLSRLVDDLLDVSRITRGKINLARERVELRDLIERAVETVTPVIEARGHTLESSCRKRPLRHLWRSAAPDPGAGQCARQCRQVHRRRRPHHAARAGAAGRDVEIAVRDTGIGISAEVLPLHLRSVHPARSSAAVDLRAGLGIGLALVRRLVEMHGGTVTATSDGPGQGSEFVILLPLSVERDGRAMRARGRARRLRPGARSAQGGAAVRCSAGSWWPMTIRMRARAWRRCWP